MKEKLKLIDTHFHIWDLEKQNLPWLEDCPQIKKSYSFDDYINVYNEQEGICFEGGVYVEVDSDDPILEDELIYNIKKKNEKLLGVVSRSKIEGQMRVPLFAKGVREPLHIDQSEPGLCLKEFFIDGIKNLNKNNLSFDSCNRVDELDDLVKMMEKTPDAKVILNHLGNVERLDEEYIRNMKKLSEFPNLYVKVSGYPTDDKDFVRDLLEFIKGTFASDRLIYASNWPVIELYSNLKEHLDILREVFNDDEDFFYNNAKKCYNL